MPKREISLLLDDMLEWAHNILSFLLLSTITFFVFFATSLSLLCNSMGAIAQSSTKVFHEVPQRFPWNIKITYKATKCYAPVGICYRD